MTIDDDEPATTLYVCRTREWVWHWCVNCPDHPLFEKNKATLDNNGLLSTMTKPDGNFCLTCLALTKAKGCTP